MNTIAMSFVTQLVHSDVSNWDVWIPSDPSLYLLNCNFFFKCNKMGLYANNTEYENVKETLGSCKNLL